jgi:hypothetical protein
MSDLDRLSADFMRAAAAIVPVAATIVEEHAKAVQATWRATYPWSGSRHLRKIGASITEEMTGATEAEIGPIKGGQGSLGHIIEFGSVNSGAHPGGGPAAMRQATPFALAIGLAAEGLMSGLSRGMTMSTSNPSRYNAPIGPRGG